MLGSMDSLHALKFRITLHFPFLELMAGRVFQFLYIYQSTILFNNPQLSATCLCYKSNLQTLDQDLRFALQVHSMPTDHLLHLQKNHLQQYLYRHPNLHQQHQRYHFLQHQDYQFGQHLQAAFLSFFIEFQAHQYQVQPSFKAFFELLLILSQRTPLFFQISQ